MKKGIVLSTLLFVVGCLLVVTPARAFNISEDPQFVVINFADLYFLKWDAPDKAWLQTEKPKAVAAIKNIEKQIGHGSEKRKLAWSTLLEYTDFPLDTPSRNSPYLVRVRRILDLAETVNIPVFIPLNGVQWWNEMPELWNFWDFDGNQTPGCGIDEYMIPNRCAFPKLTNPEYRKRFIDGYNPENKWNVEWEDWETPMKFNTRNWGGGDVLVAPPMNLIDHGRTKLVLRKIQTERFEAILREMKPVLTRWEKEGKNNLFAGISIGTEVSLNASPVPGDENFVPRGFRALQDVYCPKDKPTCGTDQSWTENELHEMRKAILNSYFVDMAKRAISTGLPKQRIYTHVWSEAEPGERKYTDALGASVTLYSRPGLSLYGKAEEPYGFSVLNNTLEKIGYSGWAAPEFSPLIKESANWQRALSAVLDNSQNHAQLINIYNERDILNTPAIPQLQSFLAEGTSSVCFPPEVIVETENVSVNPKKLVWHSISPTTSKVAAEIVISFRNVPRDASDLSSLKSKPSALPYGVYFWSVKTRGCDDTKWTVSELRTFVRLPTVNYEENKWQQLFAQVVKKILVFH